MAEAPGNFRVRSNRYPKILLRKTSSITIGDPSRRRISVATATAACLCRAARRRDASAPPSPSARFGMRYRWFRRKGANFGCTFTGGAKSARQENRAQTTASIRPAASRRHRRPRGGAPEHGFGGASGGCCVLAALTPLHIDCRPTL